jgi:GTP cyclohydrolase II
MSPPESRLQIAHVLFVCWQIRILMPMTWSGRGTSSLSDTVREAFCAGRDHTEAAVDLARLAGLIPAGYWPKWSTTMAPWPNCRSYSRSRKVSAKALCNRELDCVPARPRKTDRQEQGVNLPTDYGDFRLHLHESIVDGVHHLASINAPLPPAAPNSVRVHSERLTGEVFGSRRCDCRQTLAIDAAGRRRGS